MSADEKCFRAKTAVFDPALEYFALVIYHILRAAEWESASRNPVYAPAAFATDKFIHCCKAEQLEYVVEHYFQEKQDLVILCIDAEIVNAPVKYEDLNGEGMSFPHIYGVLNTNCVRKAVPLPCADGTFVVPSEILPIT
jgi:uncharacterized protein (DUF952 family)